MIWYGMTFTYLCFMIKKNLASFATKLTGWGGSCCLFPLTIKILRNMLIFYCKTVYELVIDQLITCSICQSMAGTNPSIHVYSIVLGESNTMKSGISIPAFETQLPRYIFFCIFLSKSCNKAPLFPPLGDSLVPAGELNLKLNKCMQKSWKIA